MNHNQVLTFPSKQGTVQVALPTAPETPSPHTPRLKKITLPTFAITKRLHNFLSCRAITFKQSSCKQNKSRDRPGRSAHCNLPPRSRKGAVRRLCLLSHKAPPDNAILFEVNGPYLTSTDHLFGTECSYTYATTTDLFGTQDLLGDPPSKFNNYSQNTPTLKSGLPTTTTIGILFEYQNVTVIKEPDGTSENSNSEELRPSIKKNLIYEEFAKGQRSNESMRPSTRTKDPALRLSASLTKQCRPEGATSSEIRVFFQTGHCRCKCDYNICSSSSSSMVIWTYMVECPHTYKKIIIITNSDFDMVRCGVKNELVSKEWGSQCQLQGNGRKHISSQRMWDKQTLIILAEQNKD
ncbi:hypothetical protein CHS0354_000177 [Potamilus streckersoni]|uniref:Uncharacterized protein n=1 Tax=Potamilus streckersoni TaxID=2493646 RepID=A0AAE0RLX8_9BIVA|nr:hypothetical protein CHS0354_000177 [Potamilus streckersoni]